MDIYKILIYLMVIILFVTVLIWGSLFNILWESFCVLLSILKLSNQPSIDIQFNFWLLYLEVLYPGYLFLDKNYQLQVS